MIKIKYNDSLTEYYCYRIIGNILQVRIFRSDAERLEFMRRNKGYKIVDSVLINYGG